MIIYETTTGRILRNIVCTPDQVRYQVGAGESAMEGTADGATHYAPLGAVTARSAMSASVDVFAIAADGVEEATISGLPAGAVVSINHVVVGEVDPAGEVVFTTDTPGEYVVRCSLFPWLDYEVTIDAI